MGIFGKVSKKQNLAPAKQEEAAEEKKPASDKKSAASEPVKRGPLAKEHGGDAYRILLTPVLTEKADRQQSLGKYTFVVAPDANKNAVAQAVRDLYGVKPVSVRIVAVKGKHVRSGRVLGKRKDQKKAIVTLKAGETITAMEGV
ncbi:MAG: 50S ribosomal protein L23 [Patescibacteria group bacterium]|jgi:large subunit ribosomal protein L23